MSLDTEVPTTSEPAAKVSDLDGKPPESTDFANYFCTYAYIYHQVCPR
jgi:protein arginine N-methyltransferase 1